MTPEQREQLQALWSAKVTTEAEFIAKIKAHNEILPVPSLMWAGKGTVRIASILDWYSSEVDPVHGAPALPHTGPEGIGGNVLGRVASTPWWLLRDMIRQIVGLYEEPTAVQKWLRGPSLCLGWQFVHTARGNAEQVAFNADLANAIADRKLTTTLGRYLRKVLPHASDEFIANVEATHRAELDDTFLIARTPEEIETVYTTMAGDGGCMRYSRSYFGLKDYHPSVIYSSPGLGVAYLRNSKEQICARAVIYDNPEDNTDRRYVRLYGDAALANKLKRAGYRCAGLRGAKLKIFKDSAYASDERRVVMPYLDPAGGRGSNEDPSFNGLSIVKFKGEEFLRVLGDQEVTRLRGIGVSTAHCQNTSAAVHIPKEVDTEKITRKCAIGGDTYIILDFEEALIYHEGAAKHIRADRLDRSVYSRTANYCADGDSTAVTLYMTDEDYAQHVFENWFINDYSMRNLGWRVLDPKFYPQVEGRSLRETMVDRWMSVPSYHLVDGELQRTDHYIRSSDLVRVFQADGSQVHAHKDLIPALLADGLFVQLAPHKKLALYCHKDHPRLRKTPRKQNVIVGFHDYSIDVDGNVISNRSMTTLSVSGQDFEVHLPRDLSTLTQESFDRMTRQVFENTKAAMRHPLKYYEDRDPAYIYRAWRDAGVFNSVRLSHPKPPVASNGFSRIDDAIVTRTYGFSPSPESIRQMPERAALIDGMPLRGESSLETMFGSIERAVVNAAWAWMVKGAAAAQAESDAVRAARTAELEAYTANVRQELSLITSSTELTGEVRRRLDEADDNAKERILREVYGELHPQLRDLECRAAALPVQEEAHTDDEF